jgi:hypothetical protein
MVENPEPEDINEIYSDLKKKYWKPEWDSMSEDEKMKDPKYCKLLYEVISNSLKNMKELKNKYKGPQQIELIDEVIANYEEILKYFTPVNEE